MDNSKKVYVGGAFVSVAAIIAAWVAIGVGGGGGTPTPTPTPTPVPDLANIFVVEGGGACAGGRSATPIAYAASDSPDRRCGSFDQAWDVVSAGDTAIIKNGTYSRQFITGDKASDTKLIGESKAGVIITDTGADCRPAFGAETIMCPDGNNIWIENVTVDANANDGPAAGSLIAGQNVTYKNVDILGQWPDLSVGSVVAECTGCDATGFTWDGGTYGDPNPPPRPCGADGVPNGEPVWVYYPNVTINGVSFNKQTVVLEITSGGTCAPDDNKHLEFFRLESGADNLTISNNKMLCGSDSGSGYIFASVGDATGLKILGNYFCNNDASTWVQIGSSPCGYIVAYNTFSGDDGSSWGCQPTYTGNLGPAVQNCSGSNVKNVWGGSGSCGTDTFVGSTSLGVGIDGTIAGSSPAVNAAEIPGASDVCTNPSLINSLDFNGDVRPFGSACDAGADEYSPAPTPTPTATPTPTPTPTATPVAITCDRTATNAAGLTSAISAASNGQIICLTNAVNYGTFAGTNKSVTILSQNSAVGVSAAPNPVAATMTLNLGSGDSNFTIDGGMERWDSPVGLNINGGTIAAGVTNVTFRDFKSTGGGGRLWTFDPGPSCGSNILIEHGHFYDLGISTNGGGEAAIYIDHTSGEPCNTGMTIRNNLFRNSSADGVKMSGEARVNILNNKFLNFKECLPGCTSNHTDAIQFYSGTGSHVIGNWVDDCEQAISGFDGMGSSVIEHNLVTRCGAHWFTNMWDRPASTWAFNTIGDSGGSFICANKTEYGASNQASLTNIRNNVARDISLTGGGATCTPTQNTNNLVNSGATSGNINGTPVFTGGSTLSSWDTFSDGCLAPGSPGKTSATDGTEVGICGGDYNGTNYGPPTGEGY